MLANPVRMPVASAGQLKSATALGTNRTPCNFLKQVIPDTDQDDRSSLSANFASVKKSVAQYRAEVKSGGFSRLFLKDATPMDKRKILLGMFSQLDVHEVEPVLKRFLKVKLQFEFKNSYYELNPFERLVNYFPLKLHGKVLTLPLLLSATIPIDIYVANQIIFDPLDKVLSATEQKYIDFQTQTLIRTDATYSDIDEAIKSGILTLKGGIRAAEGRKAQISLLMQSLLAAQNFVPPLTTREKREFILQDKNVASLYQSIVPFLGGDLRTFCKMNPNFVLKENAIRIPSELQKAQIFDLESRRIYMQSKIPNFYKMQETPNHDAAVIMKDLLNDPLYIDLEEKRRAHQISDAQVSKELQAYYEMRIRLEQYRILGLSFKTEDGELKLDD